MKRRLMSLAIVLVVLSLLLGPATGPAPANAATPAAIEASIVQGLNWIVPFQNPDGSWPGGEPWASTGFMVVKLCDRAFELMYLSPFDPAYPYSGNVIAGLDFLFGQTVLHGAGPGMKMNAGGHETYNTGIAMMALAATRAPGRIVTVPNPVVNGLTYKQVLQGFTDFFISTQNPDGGWRYFAGNQPSDQSNTGYATLGLRYAEDPLFGFNIAIPPALKANLSAFITAVQYLNLGHPDDGTSYYEVGWWWPNLLKTGNLLFEMTFVGDTTATPRVQRAIGYIERHWNDPGPDPGFKGPPVHEQSAYCLMKGLQSLGITTLNVGGNPAFDWFDDMTTGIVNSQLPAGNWPSDYWADQFLGTEWALLTLERVAPPSPTQADLCPTQYKWSTVTVPPYKWAPFPTLFQSWNQVRFVNNGPGDALNVTATISCAPVNVAVIDGMVSLGNIPAGGSAWSIDDFALATNMANPQPPNKGICWRVEYDDPAGYHHVINNVAKFCGEQCSNICP